MPKQGHFAKSSRVKQVNNFKVKRHQQGQAIATDQLTDFLVVRYALTIKRRVPVAAQETIQRLLIEVSDRLLKADGDLQKILPALLTDINSRVPWQFFKQVVEEWATLQRFLQKELPAVPLQQRLRITATVSTTELSKRVAELMATRAAVITFLNQPQLAKTMTAQTARRLLPTIYHDNQLDWEKVRALLAPFSFKLDDQLDAGTKEWLLALSKLK
jgi:hypothetical protein